MMALSFFMSLKTYEAKASPCAEEMTSKAASHIIDNKVG